MKVTASAAVSSDGYMDDCSPCRLVLSCEEDWAEVHRLRAECDAILVGAETVRRDNPSLMIRGEGLRREREERGMAADIAKVVITQSGRLDPDLRFFTEGSGAEKIVIAAQGADPGWLYRLQERAQIVTLPLVTAHAITEVLSAKGFGSLLVEGGAETLRMFIDEDMIDRMRLAVSPCIVNDTAAPRLPYFGRLPFGERCFGKRYRKVGGMKVCDYAIHPPAEWIDAEDRRRLLRAVLISEKSVPCDTAYRVGCVIVTQRGVEYEGYTHETAPHNHAEEEAIAKAVAAGADLRGATLYSSMEPCSTRSSKPVSCTELILRYGIERVVYAYAEPECFVRCEGTRLLQEAGVEVLVAGECAARVAEINSHIIH